MFTLATQDSSFSLPPGELLLVGRGEQCDVRLHDPSASRVHCRLSSRDGKVFFSDAGSRWGTFVNGTRVSECELRPGDEITIGETILRLEVTGDSQGTTLARPSELLRPPGLTIHTDSSAPGSVPLRTPIRHADQPVGRPASALSAADYIGQTFFGCEVHELHRRTRTGLVFRASRKGTDVALKLLQPITMCDSTARQRFLRAVDVARGLRHENLVELIDGGIFDGIPFTVSEFVHGECVTEVIQRIGVVGMLDWRTTLRIGLDLAAALEFIESHGVLHRNITPQHVLIRATDKTAKLNDLLLAKAIDDSQPALTQSGEFVGELPYQSPEQLGSGQPVDQRSDIYQLGAMLYALLTGRPPFEGRNAAAIISQVLTDPPVPPKQFHLAIPALLEGAVLTMLAKRPQDRFASAADLVKTLKRVEQFSG